MAFSPHDVVPDSPINNFATLNPLQTAGVSSSTFREGNLEVYSASATNSLGVSNFAMGSGKWYFEAVTNSSDNTIGIFKSPINPTGTFYSANLNYRWYGADGKVYNDSTFVQTYNTYTSGDVLSVALDLDNGKVFYAKNGVWQGSGDFAAGTNPAVSGLTGEWVFAVNAGSSTGRKVTTNFGQDHSFGGTKTGGAGATDANGLGQFYYQPPDGALALCTKNIPSGPINIANDDVPSDYFRAVIWTGEQNGSANNVVKSVNVGFQGDLIWMKGRNQGGNSNTSWHVFDSVRGGKNRLDTADTIAEGVTGAANNWGGFTSTGFDVIYNAPGYFNWTSQNSVAYVWKAAGAPADNQARIIDTDGSLITKTTADLKSESDSASGITPTKVSANRKSGFSIVAYNGIGDTNSVNPNPAYQIPHGLSQKPELIIEKNLTRTYYWSVQGCGELWTPATSNLFLNGTNALNPSGAHGEPTDQWFYPSRDGYANQSGRPQIAYIFHSVAGYSKFGSYTSNGSNDGPMVNLSFKPSLILLKVASGSVASSYWSWCIYDNSRNEYNPAHSPLYANHSVAEGIRGNGSGANGYALEVDFLSNGFKVRTNATEFNSSDTQTVIYCAWAESPFNAPSNAR